MGTLKGFHQPKQQLYHVDTAWGGGSESKTEESPKVGLSFIPLLLRTEFTEGSLPCPFAHS